MARLFKTTVIYSQFSRDPSLTLHHGPCQFSQTLNKARAVHTNSTTQEESVVSLTLEPELSGLRLFGTISNICTYIFIYIYDVYILL